MLGVIRRLLKLSGEYAVKIKIAFVFSFLDFISTIYTYKNGK